MRNPRVLFRVTLVLVANNDYCLAEARLYSAVVGQAALLGAGILRARGSVVNIALLTVAFPATTEQLAQAVVLVLIITQSQMDSVGFAMLGGLRYGHAAKTTTTTKKPVGAEQLAQAVIFSFLRAKRREKRFREKEVRGAKATTENEMLMIA